MHTVLWCSTSNMELISTFHSADCSKSRSWLLSHIAPWKVIKIKINNDWKIKAVTHFVFAVASRSSEKNCYISTWRSRSNRTDEIKTKQRNKSQLLILPLSEIKRNLTWVIFGKKTNNAETETWRNAILQRFGGFQKAIWWWCLQGQSL